MIYPAHLHKKSIVKLISPSNGVPSSKHAVLHKAKTRLKKFFKVKDSLYQYNSSKFESTTPSRRAEEFIVDWQNNNYSALHAVVGGEFMMEILPYLDSEKLKTFTPKWFIGYSDNTILTHYITTALDTATVYHYIANNFGDKKLNKSHKDLISLLYGQKFTFNSQRNHQTQKVSLDREILSKDFAHKVEYKLVAPKEHITPKKSLEVKGRMLGGCLDILQVFAGTKYDHTKSFIEKYKDDGIIWYLENCDLSNTDNKRALWKLYTLGWFDTAKAFLIGRPLIYNKVNGLDHYNSTLDILERLNVPIIFGVDIGHVHPTIPVVNGSIGVVNYTPEKTTISYIFE